MNHKRLQEISLEQLDHVSGGLKVATLQALYPATALLSPQFKMLPHPTIPAFGMGSVVQPLGVQPLGTQPLGVTQPTLQPIPHSATLPGAAHPNALDILAPLLRAAQTIPISARSPATARPAQPQATRPSSESGGMLDSILNAAGGGGGGSRPRGGGGGGGSRGGSPRSGSGSDGGHDSGRGRGGERGTPSREEELDRAYERGLGDGNEFGYGLGLEDGRREGTPRATPPSPSWPGQQGTEYPPTPSPWPSPPGTPATPGTPGTPSTWSFGSTGYTNGADYARYLEVRDRVLNPSDRADLEAYQRTIATDPVTGAPMAEAAQPIYGGSGLAPGGGSYAEAGAPDPSQPSWLASAQYDAPSGGGSFPTEPVAAAETVGSTAPEPVAAAAVVEAPAEIRVEAGVDYVGDVGGDSALA